MDGLITEMIYVSKELAEYIKRHSPNSHINETCKDKSKAKRRKRYVEETPKVKQLIKEYNKQLNITETYPPQK